MRMRKKPNLVPRMERCAALLETNPEERLGGWLNGTEYKALHLEIGCGKGRFTTAVAGSMPDTLLVALERVEDAIVVAMERALEAEVGNVRFLAKDAKELEACFAPGEINRIYINFCDPWPKSRDAKHRLTSPFFLRSYARLLPIGGEIHFKTDNRPLFDWSLEQLEAEGWTLKEQSFDLHRDGINGFMTDYEAKFHAEGVPICRTVAVRTEATRFDGVPERLRNASLADARANQTEGDSPCE